jgi:NTP pyrophosphatase (non-canonical NTP hydrolase)
MNIDEKIIKRAISTWGDRAQTNMLSEECTELSLAVQKYLNRGKQVKHYTNLIEEIADVNIMIAQANMMFPKEQIQIAIDEKLQRLSDRLDRKEF